MSYDLHITRAGDWIDAAQHPIPRAEWERFAESHPELIQDGEVSWRDIGTQPIYSFTLPEAARHGCHGATNTCTSMGASRMSPPSPS